MKSTLLLLAVLMAALCAHADPRQWDHAGLPIRQGTYLEWQRCTARDAAGYTLVVWTDTRSGNREVYARLISPTGTALWTADGLNVTQSPGYQQDPVACAVNGGWIIAWIDFQSYCQYVTAEEEPSACGNVWAQKLSYSGAGMWGAGGLPVDTTSGTTVQQSLQIAPDGSGGAIIAWLDDRASRSEIYAQRVLAAGQTAWTAPSVLTPQTYGMWGCTAASDGNGNMLLSWSSYNEQYNQDIYAAKITVDGQLPWGGQHGITVRGAPGTQVNSSICADGQGGGYIAWANDNNSYSYNLFMQRLDAAGALQWSDSGIVLCDAAHTQRQVHLAASFDGSVEDGCLAVWEDTRINGEDSEIYGQKISAAGTALWARNGILISGDAGLDSLHPSWNSRRNPALASDLSGGLICVWEDGRDTGNPDWPYDLYAVRVLDTGELIWNGDLGNLVANGPGMQDLPAITVNGTSVLTLYNDSRSGSGSLRLQRLALADGARLLPDSGVVLFTSLDGQCRQPQAVAMTSGRTAMVWADGRNWGYYGTLHYQIITNGGQFEKPLNGTSLVPDYGGSAYCSQQDVRLCTDNFGGFFAAYEDSRTGMYRVRLSHVNSAGDITGNPAGDEVWPNAQSADQVFPYCTPDGLGGCFVAWSNYNQSYLIDVYVMRLDAACHPIWQQPVRLTNTDDDDYVHGLVSNPDGSCTVVWTSGTYNDFNVSAAKINGNGHVAYNLTACNAPLDQEDPAVVADGLGGAYLAWVDKRHCLQSELRYAIYAQHLNSQGMEIWTHNGIAAAMDSAYFAHPRLALGGDGNLLAMWEDWAGNELGENLYGQKIMPSGALLWPDSGKGICLAAGDQSGLSLLPDNGTGFFVAWSDRGEANNWNYAQVNATHLSADGDPVGDSYWVPGHGGPLTAPTGQLQQDISLASDGTGGAIAVWTDYRCTGVYQQQDIWAQHIVDALQADKPSSVLPSVYALSQNYPNPFNPTTRISFALPKAGMTTLKVYDLLGREVSTLLSKSLPAGEHSVSFEGHRLASGLYFYRIESGSFSATKKMVLLK
ncbi:MAG TPA: T9SS type A sorting domain-containing protein [bacterium]